MGHDSQAVGTALETPELPPVGTRTHRSWHGSHTAKTNSLMLALRERGQGTQPQRTLSACVGLEGEGRTQSVGSRSHSHTGTWGTRCETDGPGARTCFQSRVLQPSLAARH